MIKKISIALASFVFLSACNTSTIKSDTVQVYKYDRSVSCNQSSGVSVDTMKLELQKRKIPIVALSCGNDGLVRAAVCGIDTGQINIFEISADAYPEAKEMGYELVSLLEDYSTRACN